MKDLEDLLPDKSLIPPPVEEEPPPPGTLTHSHIPLLLMLSVSLHLTNLATVLFSAVVNEKGSKSPKTKPGAAGKGVNLQKDVSLAATNPRGPVTRAPGPRGGPPGNARGPQPGRGRGRGGPR